MPTPPSNFSLQGKIILLCGGTGTLGHALLQALVDAGATVIATSRQPARFDKLRTTTSFDRESLDLMNESSILTLRNRVLQRYGALDGLVFNAVQRSMTSMRDDLSAWSTSMHVNATGLFCLERAFGDAMAEQSRGSIVNIASIHGMVGMNPWLYEGNEIGAAPDYFFHKAGVVNLTRYLAAHYGPHGVRVNAVSPGGILKASAPQSPAFQARYGAMTALGRLAQATEITGAVLFLLSGAASYITGVNLPVDGGYTAR